MSRILTFAGSARGDSFNKRIAGVAAEGARSAGADVTVIDLADYPLPIMDQDLEAEHGLPKNAVALKDLFLAHEGFLIACPEYNSSITPLLKNVIDWVSRPREGEARLGCFQGKVAALVSASPGALGGIRGLREVRSILGSIGTIVIPDQVAVGLAHEKIDGGVLTDDGVAERLRFVGKRLVEITARLNG